MSLWNKIVLGTKFICGGFEAATDYVLDLLNEFLGKDNIAGRVQKIREFATTILTYLKKYEKYCPAIWAPDYLKLIAVIQTLVDVLKHDKITQEELQSTISSVQQAIQEWMN